MSPASPHEHRPDHPDQSYELRLARADDLIALSRGAEAMEALLRLLRDFPERAGETRLSLARAHRLANRLGRAAEQARLAVAAMPQDPMTHLELGICLASQDRLGEAEDCLRTSLRLDPHHAPAWIALSTTLAAMKWQEQAFAAASEAVRLEPELPAAHYVVALSLLKTDPPLAEQALREALRLDPQFSPALKALTAFYLKRRNERSTARSAAHFAATAPAAPEARLLTEMLLARVVSGAQVVLLPSMFAILILLRSIRSGGSEPSHMLVVPLIMVVLTALIVHQRGRHLHEALPRTLASQILGLLRRRRLLALQALLMAGMWAAVITTTLILLVTGATGPLHWVAVAGIAQAILGVMLTNLSFLDAEDRSVPIPLIA